MTTESNSELWIQWAARLSAIAQTGLTFAKDPFDVERYHSIGAIAAETGKKRQNGPTSPPRPG